MKDIGWVVAIAIVASLYLPRFISALDALIRIARALPHMLHMLHWIMRYQYRALYKDDTQSEPDWIKILDGKETYPA